MQHDIEYIRSILQNSEEWITVKGNHIKLKDGETAKEATQRFIEEKQNKPKGSKVTGYEKSDPENAVKFIKPSFEITNDRKETIKNFKTWYKENLQGKSVVNPILGDILFSSRGMNETKHQNLSNFENLKYIAVVPEILKTSKDIIKEDIKHKENKPDVKNLYRVYGYINYKGDIRKINLIILENINNIIYYTFDIREKARSLEAPVQTGSENLTYNSYDTHRLSFVNSFELNLYVTETDFRMFEINF